MLVVLPPEILKLVLLYINDLHVLISLVGLLPQQLIIPSMFYDVSVIPKEYSLRHPLYVFVYKKKALFTFFCSENQRVSVILKSISCLDPIQHHIHKLTLLWYPFESFHFQKLRSLTLLDIKSAQQTVSLDLKSLASLPLKHLLLLNFTIEHASFIVRMDLLRSLSFVVCKGVNVDFSSYLFLEHLRLQYCDIIPELHFTSDKLVSLRLISSPTDLSISCSNLEELDLIGFSSAPIQSICTPRLKSLNLMNNRLTEVPIDLGFELLSIESLDLSQNPIVSLSGIEKYWNLKQVSLFSTHIRDMTPLLACPALSVINVNDCDISDAPDLTSLNQLWSLNLGTNQIRCIPRLPSCLRELKAHNNKFSILDLRNLANLESLGLRSSQCSWLEGIQYCSKLRSLDLSYTTFKAYHLLPTTIEELRLLGNDEAGFENIKVLPILKLLDLQYFLKKDYDGKWMSLRFPQLETLLISSTSKVNSLIDFCYLDHLKELNLSALGLQDISGIHDLPALNALVLTRCGITSIPSGFRNFRSLKSIDFARNAIKVVDNLDHLNSQYTVNIRILRIAGMTNKMANVKGLNFLGL